MRLIAPKKGNRKGLTLYRISNIALVTLTLLAVVPMSVDAARNYYVNAVPKGLEDGSNINNFCTLSYANANMSAGDIALLYDNGGVIHQRIEPARNGTAGSPIIYQAGIDESPIVSSPDIVDADGLRSAIGIIGSEKNERSYITISGINATTLNTKSNQRFFNIKWSNHITFNSCTFKTPVWSGNNQHSDINYTMSSIKDSSYLQFINCEWGASTTPTHVDSQNDLLYMERISHSLWKECKFGDVSHTPVQIQYGLGESEYNAFIDCLFTNRWRRAFAFIAKPWAKKPERWIVQGNVMANIAWDNQNCPTFADRGRLSLSYIDSKRVIIRENIYYGNDVGLSGRSMRDTDVPEGNYTYHNTIYNNKKPEGNEKSGGIGFYLGNIYSGFENNVIINNIFWQYEGLHLYTNRFQFVLTVTRDKPAPKGNVFAYNSFGRKNDNVLETSIAYNRTSGSLSRVESLETEWHDNILADPGFIDPDNPNFEKSNFTPTNPDIVDSARHLTVTKNAGTNSNKLIVDDAGYFFSGPNSPWFLENTLPDNIYIEGSGAVRISSIDYSTNTIYLTEDKTWNINKKVYHRPFSGSGPDIGAIEKAGPRRTTVKIRSYSK